MYLITILNLIHKPRHLRLFHLQHSDVVAKLGLLGLDPGEDGGELGVALVQLLLHLPQAVHLGLGLAAVLPQPPLHLVLHSREDADTNVIRCYCPCSWSLFIRLSCWRI